MRYMKFILLCLLLAGCATTSGYARIPDQVTEWLESNSWRVETSYSGGSGFWVDGRFLTACHIVSTTPVAYIHNIDRSRLTLTKVESCDLSLDIAILKPIDSPNNTMEGFKPLPIKLAVETPRPGTLIYSAGWHMGGPFGYTYGVLNSLSKDGYEAEMHMVYGDSGSPVLALRDGRIELIGILLSINTIVSSIDGQGGIKETEVFGSSVLHGIEDIRAVLEAA